MPINGFWSGMSYDRAQPDRNDHGVVKVPEDGDEVRHQIDGRSNVGYDEQQPETDSAWECRVGSEPSEEAHNIG